MIINNEKQLYLSATGFYVSGLDMAAKVKNARNENIWRIAPVATVNLSFATELFLKFLIYSTTQAKEIKKHEFLVLYEKLPLKIGRKIKKKYDELSKLESDLPIIRLSSNTDFGNPDDQITKYHMPSLTIEQLLEVHNNSFPEWRYAFATEERHFVIDYNFKLMNDFILAMIHVIEEEIV